MIEALVLAAALASPGCAPVPGAQALWSNASIQYVMIGELHGSREPPAIFRDLVCEAASSGRPVIVALERSESEQPYIDRYMVSDGGAVARQALLSSHAWTDCLQQDGRSSQAYLRLIDDLRVLKSQGRIAGVVAFQSVGPNFDPAKNITVQVNEGMAIVLRNALAAAQPKSIILALMGSLHAQKEGPEFEALSFKSAAALLPPTATLSLIVSGEGGEAWNCQAGACGPHPVGPSERNARGIVMTPADHDGFDGTIHLGDRFTVSPPAGCRLDLLDK